LTAVSFGLAWSFADAPVADAAEVDATTATASAPAATATVARRLRFCFTGLSFVRFEYHGGGDSRPSP
jgi:hypothetical protein